MGLAMMGETEDHNRTPTPKNTDLPETGWVCNGISDIQPKRETCQFCEKAQIRYVHLMRHEEWPEELRCGCICAGHMEEDLIGAKQRERDLINKIAREKAAEEREEKARIEAELARIEQEKREQERKKLQEEQERRARQEEERVTASNGLVWETSRNDNLYLPLKSPKGEGTVTLFRRKDGSGFGYFVKNTITEQTKFCPTTFKTEAEARDAASVEVAPIVDDRRNPAASLLKLNAILNRKKAS